MYGSHSAGCKAGDPGWGPLSVGTGHHVQAGSKVSGGEEGRREDGGEEDEKGSKREKARES